MITYTNSVSNRVVVQIDKTLVLLIWLFRTQIHFPSICPSIIFYRLFRTLAILELFFDSPEKRSQVAKSIPCQIEGISGHKDLE